MISWTPLLTGFFAGLGAGIFFFGGLWLTITRLPFSSRPRTLVWSSFIVRNLLTLVLMTRVCQTDWHKWAAALAGFLAARTLILHKQAGQPPFSL